MGLMYSLKWAGIAGFFSFFVSASLVLELLFCSIFTVLKQIIKRGGASYEVPVALMGFYFMFPPSRYFFIALPQALSACLEATIQHTGIKYVRNLVEISASMQKQNKFIPPTHSTIHPPPIIFLSQVLTPPCEERGGGR
ncbi:hypothetical protein F4775DRAFT_354408 [Biscogniauxia sp. FL1348]|nr:hypothetical protein F4775DRAFT_354408 [Biscogniauxia sp. FL1348]